MATRLILDDPLDGAWNMAVDEAILLATAERGAPTLRIYRWSEATLSLGYFQRHQDRRAHAPSADRPIVRRSSGGGAIMHDQEFTYSYCTPIRDRMAAELRGLYRQFHQALIDSLLACCGEQAHVVQAAATAKGDEPFLCFQRRAEGDVTLHGAKILGSAQRRRAGALLQHGSVLCSQSAFAPELPGIAQLVARPFSPEELLDRWLATLQERLGVEFVPSRLSEQEKAAARELHVEIFASSSWLQRR